MLTLAATRGDHLVRPPQLPIAAARQVIRSLLKAGLVEEVPAPIEDAAYAWRTREDGSSLMLQATDSGLAQVDEREVAQPVLSTEPKVPTGKALEVAAARGTEADAIEATTTLVVTDTPASATQEAQPGQDNASTGEVTAQRVSTAQAAPTTPARARQATVRQAAQALLDASDDLANREHDIIGSLDGLFADLRAALMTHTTTNSIHSHHQQKDTKQSQVLAMLRRPEGAAGPAIAEAMGWAPHTVRGFLAGLAKKGITVDVLERVRQIGPNKAGAKGSYTIYRIAE